MTGTQPHFTHIPLRLPRQGRHALDNTFVQAQEVETLLRQLQHFIPGLHQLAPLLIYDGNHIIDNSDFDSDDDTVVLQIPPGNSILRPQRPPIVTPQLPRPPAERLMDLNTPILLLSPDHQ